MQLGQPVTWDNPDVRIFLGGVEQYTYNLTVSTEYDVEVTVHNASRDKPADGTAVDIHWIEFGAGGQIKHPITITATNVPVWPGTSVVTTKWKTPDTPAIIASRSSSATPMTATRPITAAGTIPKSTRRIPRSRATSAFSIGIPGNCPPIREGGGPWLRPHRIFLGWGPIGGVAALPLQHQLPHDTPVGLGILALFLAGYIVASIVGLIAESIYLWIRRRSNDWRAGNPRTDRVDCHLVEIKVDSYEFGRQDRQGLRSRGRVHRHACALGCDRHAIELCVPARRSVSGCHFKASAPDAAGAPGHFNLNVWQGGVPSGGVTLTVTTGG